jgi:hypothetical protein
MLVMKNHFFAAESMNLVLDPAGGRGGLYLGNIEAAHSLQLLHKHQIKAVLTAA